MSGEDMQAMVRLGAAYGAPGYPDDDDDGFLFEAVGGYDRAMSVNPDRLRPAAEENPVRGGRG